MTVGMIEMMPQSELMEWMEFSHLEPFGVAVPDILHAHALSTHANMRRDPEQNPTPFKIDDFRLFMDRPEVREEPRVQGLTAAEWRQRFALEALAATRLSTQSQQG